MKSNKIILMSMIVLAAVLLLGVFFWPKKNRMEPIVVKVDEIQDVKGLGYSGQRKVVVDGIGNIFATYRKKYQGKYEIFVAKISKENSTFKVSGTSNPISMVGSGADQRVPSMTVDLQNNLHVVWYGVDGNAKKNSDNRQIKYSQSLNGGTNWSNWKNIAVVDGYNGEKYWQEHPYILTGDKKQLFVVWEGKDSDNKNQQIKFSKSVDGGNTWTAWKNISQTPDNTQSRPTMTAEKNGKLHLFFYSSFGSSDDKQQIVHVWSNDDGASWSKWEIISDPNFDSRHASVAIDHGERVHVVWRSLDSTGHALIMHRFLQNNHWSQLQAVSSSNANQFFPSVMADAGSNIFISWMESEKPSNLPNEDPSDGKVYLSKFSANKYSNHALIDQSSFDLYPNLPEKTRKGISPLLYETRSASSDSFSINMYISAKVEKTIK